LVEFLEYLAGGRLTPGAIRDVERHQMNCGDP
jgi:hypothetical protein